MKKLDHEEIQAEAFKVLSFVKRICNENELTYYLMYGTLLGAVRHNGFIPWDDDVDIAMPRNDYERLKKILLDSATKQNLKFHDRGENADYPYLIGRICSQHTSIKRHDEHYDKMGVFVDVYPIDNISNVKIVAVAKGIFLGCLSSMFFASTRTQQEPYCNGKMVRRLYMLFSKSFGSKSIAALIEFIARSTKSELCTNYVGPATWMTLNAKRNVFDRKYFSSKDEVIFNGEIFTAPNNHKELLAEYYGDYMTLPPVENRKPHHEYEAYINDACKEM